MKSVQTQFHPDDNLLTEFAAGTLDTAQAIAISAHLHYCPRCRSKVNDMNAVGAMLLSMTSEQDIDISQSIGHQDTDNSGDLLSFDSLMESIEQRDAVPAKTPSPIPEKYQAYPKVVQKMLVDQKPKWKRVTSHLKSANLISGQNEYGIYLQHISAGGQVPEHDHRGDEITVVLKGSISDEDGVYQMGDFIYKAEGDIHRPRASSNEDCLCLSIQQAPVKLTGMLGRFINPFLRIKAV